jgi:integrase
MPRRKTLTERQIGQLPRKDKRYHLPDPIQPHLILRVPTGPVTYVAVARRKKGMEGGRQVWKTLGTSAYLTLEEARTLTRDAVKRIRTGQPLDDVQRDSVADVTDRWLKLVVNERGYRTARERERIVRKYLVPKLGNRVFVAVRRSDVASMLDDIAENNGKAQADQVLKTFGAIASWWSKREDDYRSPIVRGMRRGEATKRDRVLDDDEIRLVWKAAERFGATGGFVRFALLCAQRHAKIVDLCWDDLDGDVWDIRQGAREKGTAGRLRLPPLALEVIRQRPRIAGKERIFGWPHSRTLAQLRKEAGAGGWTIHDLRRTARTLLSRARVPTEIAELVLGHSIKGIQQVYDRHSYSEEKAHALAALAQLVENILSPPAANVIALGAL